MSSKTLPFSTAAGSLQQSVIQTNQKISETAESSSKQLARTCQDLKEKLKGQLEEMRSRLVESIDNSSSSSAAEQSKLMQNIREFEAAQLQTIKDAGVDLRLELTSRLTNTEDTLTRLSESHMHSLTRLFADLESRLEESAGLYAAETSRTTEEQSDSLEAKKRQELAEVGERLRQAKKVSAQVVRQSMQSWKDACINLRRPLEEVTASACLRLDELLNAGAGNLASDLESGKTSISNAYNVQKNIARMSIIKWNAKIAELEKIFRRKLAVRQVSGLHKSALKLESLLADSKHNLNIVEKQIVSDVQASYQALDECLNNVTAMLDQDLDSVVVSFERTLKDLEAICRTEHPGNAECFTGQIDRVKEYLEKESSKIALSFRRLTPMLLDQFNQFAGRSVAEVEGSRSEAINSITARVSALDLEIGRSAAAFEEQCVSLDKQIEQIEQMAVEGAMTVRTCRSSLYLLTSQ